MIIPNIWENPKNGNQTTNQLSIFHHPKVLRVFSNQVWNTSTMIEWISFIHLLSHPTEQYWAIEIHPISIRNASRFIDFPPPPGWSESPTHRIRMYAIYGNIYHQYTPVMLAYIPYMDPMGNKKYDTVSPVSNFSNCAINEAFPKSCSTSKRMV